MAPLRLVVVNDRNVAIELEQKGPKLVAAMDPVVRRGALRVAARMIKLINRGGRSGRLYSRPGGTVHQASAPDEPPKSDSGFLASHIKPTATTKKGTVVSATVVVSALYGSFLELGTSLMAPRPFVAPSFALEAPKINQDAARAVRKALR